MKRTVITIPANEQLTNANLKDLRFFLSKEEREEMKRKKEEILGDLRYSTHTERLIAADGFERGYLAAHVVYDPTECKIPEFAFQCEDCDCDQERPEDKKSGAV
jgi:hypothetical protein